MVICVKHVSNPTNVLLVNKTEKVNTVPAQMVNMTTDNKTPTVMIVMYNVKLVKIIQTTVPLVLETESESMNVIVTTDSITPEKNSAHLVLTNVKHVKNKPTFVKNVTFQEHHYQHVTVQKVCMKPLT